jgi:hypothetical protein
MVSRVGGDLNDLLDCVGTFLREDALNMYFIDPNSYETWEDLKNDLVSTFMPPAADSIIQKAIDNKQQNKFQSFANYSLQMRSLFSKLSYKVPREVQFQKIFDGTRKVCQQGAVIRGNVGNLSEFSQLCKGLDDLDFNEIKNPKATGKFFDWDKFLGSSGLNSQDSNNQDSPQNNSNNNGLQNNNFNRDSRNTNYPSRTFTNRNFNPFRGQRQQSFRPNIPRQQFPQRQNRFFNNFPRPSYHQFKNIPHFNQQQYQQRQYNNQPYQSQFFSPRPDQPPMGFQQSTQTSYPVYQPQNFYQNSIQNPFSNYNNNQQINSGWGFNNFNIPQQQPINNLHPNTPNYGNNRNFPKPNFSNNSNNNYGKNNTNAKKPQQPAISNPKNNDQKN